MPQSILPDLNTKFNLYTREAINGWKSQNYSDAIGALNSFNALLPDSDKLGHYRVLVDTQEYERKTKQDLVMFCKHCEPDLYGEEPKKIEWETVKTVSYYSVKIINAMLSVVERVLAGEETEEIWYCPRCGNDNELKSTRMVQKILRNPSFIAVVPEPPIKNSGIIDRTQFQTKFTVWFWTFLNELEAQAAKYRQEYTPKEGEDNTVILESQETGEDKDL